MNEHIKILDASDINRILTRIAHEIIEVHKGAENIALIGIHTRGVHLAKRLRETIYNTVGVEINTGSMDINLYRDDWTHIRCHPVVQASNIPFSVEERQIIFVDDVLFTGRTIRAALNSILDFGRPDRIELAVLVDRGFRELPIQADYVGKFVKTNRSERVNVLLQEQDGTDEVTIE